MCKSAFKAGSEFVHGHTVESEQVANSLPRLVNVSDWRVITQKYAYGVQTVLHSIHRRIRQRPGISRIYLGQETLTS